MNKSSLSPRKLKKAKYGLKIVTAIKIKIVCNNHKSWNKQVSKMELFSKRKHCVTACYVI